MTTKKKLCEAADNGDRGGAAADIEHERRR